MPSIATLIIGPSGSGKTTSMRNMRPEKTLLIQTIEKPLPFSAKGWTRYAPGKPGPIFHAATAEQIISAMRRTAKPVIVIDDFQYMLAREFLTRSSEKGYEKFTDIALHTWQVIDAAAHLKDYQRVYILTHTQTDDFGQVKMKTVGKMIDEKIVPEGFFSIVLRSLCEAGAHYFSTKTNGQDPCKTPIGLFDDSLIDNDLFAVDVAICAYYDIAQPEAQQPQAA